MYQVAILDVVNTKLPTMRDDKGLWISLRELSDGMGLDFASQSRKLKSDNRYNLSEKLFNTNGGEQKKICISINQLPTYLYSINPKRVKASSKEFVLKFQEHTFEVINNYWLNKKQIQKQDINFLEINQKFDETLSALSQKSIEADNYKEKYYQALELSNKLLLERLNQELEPVKGKYLTDEEKSIIKARYKSGIGIFQIAKEIKRSKSGVTTYLKKENLYEPNSREVHYGN